LLEAGFRVGFHPHNNIQMAFANTVEAIRTGVHIIDSSIYGMGRGAGNLPTEIILSYLMRRSANSYNVLPVLNCIERFFLDLRQETPWGYELPFMISGMLNCHPNYAKEFLRRKTFSMEDIWAGIECIRELHPVGFSADMVEKLISSGLVSASKGGAIPCADQTDTPVPESLPKPLYIDRHKGREFLVLANGPTLKAYKSEITEFIRHYNPVVLGANYLGGLLTPDYHAFNNKKRFVTHVNEVDPSSRLLLGVNFPPEMIREYSDREYEPLVFHDVLGADFNVIDGVITANCGTISVLLVGVAVVMGADRVFVAGMDGYLDRRTASHHLFYDEKFDSEEHDLNVKRHETNERFLKQIDEYIRQKGGEGVHIITPTTHTGFYKNMNSLR
jgi:4-hydroxy 2-oxovalerate aldolase